MPGEPLNRPSLRWPQTVAGWTSVDVHEMSSISKASKHGISIKTGMERSTQKAQPKLAGGRRSKGAVRRVPHQPPLVDHAPKAAAVLLPAQVGGVEHRQSTMREVI